MCAGGAIDDMFKKDNWGWLASGLGVGPKWFKDHKDIAIPIAAAAALYFTGGAAAPLLAGAEGAGAAGAAGAAGLGAGEVAGDAYLPGLLSAEMGAGGGAGGLAGSMAMGGGEQSLMSQLQTGGMNLLGGSENYDRAAKLAKLGMRAQQSGLLGGGQRQPTALAAPQPGGGAQMPGGPTSAQIAFPDAYQPAPPYFPLDEILRKRMREGY